MAILLVCSQDMLAQLQPRALPMVSSIALYWCRKRHHTGAGSGITRALKFTPDIKFVNDETLNEFVVTVERRNVGETSPKNDRDSDREDRDKRDEEDRDNPLSSKYIENNEAAKRDKDGVEETEDRTRNPKNGKGNHEPHRLLQQF